MKKSLVLAMAMALGVTASAYAANPFSDVPAGHWAYDAVNKLAAEGVVDGYPDGTYGGDKLMTRYEMAQIVAKAMAKGANVDKLAAEFADELDSLGVRVANLEKKADNVKITGEIRAHYASHDKSGEADESTIRTRLYVNGQVNEDWSYTGMIENEQDLLDEVGNDDDVRMAEAYLNGRLGGMEVQGGRWNEVPFSGNILDSYFDGVKVSYGNEVKIFGIAGKAPSEEYFKSSSDRLYVAGVKEIWTVGATYNFAEDWALSAEYMRGDKDYAYDNGKGEEKAGKDGWYASLAWKGAEASEPGSYGVHAMYFDQSANAFINPTTDANTFADMGGYKGYGVGFDVALAENIVAVVNYYDTESQVGDEDDQVIFSELYFTF